MRRREAGLALLSLLAALQPVARAEPEALLSEPGGPVTAFSEAAGEAAMPLDSVDVVGQSEGVTEQEKIAESSYSKTDSLGSRGGTSPPPAGEFKTLQDNTLAYEFSYPVRSSDGKQLSVVLSRRPERYSSAAPMTADARQRIVSELVDFANGVTISVTVGPPSGVLKGRKPQEWKPKEVADTILIDRSTARVTTGQRVSLHQVERSRAEERDGTTYWTYEHLSQGSPNIRNPDKETYRHAVAVTAWRPGQDGTPYLYTLNLACPDEMWDKLGPLYEQAAETFRLTSPGRGYVPPDKDPWRFF